MFLLQCPPRQQATQHVSYNAGPILSADGCPPDPATAAAASFHSPPSALGMLETVVELQPGDVVVQNGGTSAVAQVCACVHWQHNSRDALVLRACGPSHSVAHACPPVLLSGLLVKSNVLQCVVLPRPDLLPRCCTSLRGGNMN
jgi:hypothetical protein